MNKYVITLYYNIPISIRYMAQNSIKDEVSRILSSDTSKVLVSQLKSMNSFESTIE